MLAWVQEHYIELFGAISGIVYVFLEIRQNIWLWPLGIITSAIYIYVFYHSQFYADMGLQWYYLFISIYGWFWWKRESSRGKLKVSRLYPKLGLRLAVITIVIFFIIRFVLIRFTDSQIPGWDSFTTALSIVATWMLARKIIEHWILWIVADLVSMALYIYKGLYPTVILFAVYTLMAFVGYREWSRSKKESSAY